MFGKIFKSIYYGSLAPDRNARELMICLCVHCDKTGWVDMTLRSVGRIIFLSDAELETAANTLLSPDPNSSSPAEEGRRITARNLDTRGVQIVNYEAYRAMQTEDERREYNRQYYLEHAHATPPAKPLQDNDSISFNIIQESSGHSGQAEAEAEADKREDTVHAPNSARTPRAAFSKPTLKEITAYCQERRNGVDPGAWIDHYEANGWRVGRNPMRSWKAAVRTWEKNGLSPSAQATEKPRGRDPVLVKAEQWKRDQEAELAAGTEPKDSTKPIDTPPG